MKIAVTGKGGVGKTTFSAILARLYAEENRKVLAADVDPDANLGLALGFTESELAEITPISEMRALISERTGASQENFGKLFRLNPRVDDIPKRFAKEKNGVRLLVLGTVDTAGSGCVCPEHVLLKSIISNLIIGDEDVVIMDMEAGLEHLGRGTTSCMDSFIVVVEPGARSIQTYRKIKTLAKELGVKNVNVVANKIRTAEDEAFILENVPDADFLGFIHYNPDLAQADRQGRSPYDFSPSAVEEIRAIKRKLDGVTK